MGWSTRAIGACGSQLAAFALVLACGACSDSDSRDGHLPATGAVGGTPSGVAGEQTAGDTGNPKAGAAGTHSSSGGGTSGGAGAGGEGGRAGTSGIGGSAGSAVGAGTGPGGMAAGGDSGTSAPTCRDGVYQSETYHVCPQAGLDRASARAFCQQRGADLVTLDDANEESWLYGFVTESGSIWIGANDIEQEGDWRWPDGSAVSGGHTAWAAGQPNDSASGEDCAVLHSGMGEWNDVACDVVAFGSDPLTVVCEP